MPLDRKSAADLVNEAKAKATGIPYVKRTLDDLEDGKIYNPPGQNSTNAPTDPPAKREPSAAQLSANKANGLKSTGPKTAEGKARVAQNALKHGLRSERNPLDISTQDPGEQTQFTALLTDLTAAHQATGAQELQLVSRLAQLTLRLNRAAHMETAALDQSRSDALAWAEKFPNAAPGPNTPDFETHILANTTTRASNQLKLLSQYESRLSHDFARTLRQLLQLQKLRKQTQPPPTRSLASNGQIAHPHDTKSLPKQTQTEALTKEKQPHPETERNTPSDCDPAPSVFEAPPPTDGRSPINFDQANPTQEPNDHPPLT